MLYYPFHSKKITDISIINDCFVRIDFHTALGFIATVTALSFLRPGGALMARGMDFRRPRLGEYTAPSSLCSYLYTPEFSHCSHNRISVSSGKGLDFIKNDVFLILKYDGNYN